MYGATTFVGVAHVWMCSAIFLKTVKCLLGLVSGRGRNPQEGMMNDVLHSQVDRQV
jgi:hypothetical protein